MLRDASSTAGPDWLTRLSPEDWIRKALAELSRAEQLLQAHDRTGAVLSLRRAAGMSLNGALCVSFRDWGRTYVEHVRAVATDDAVPSTVQQAAQLLMAVPLEREPNVVRLTPPSEGGRWLEATKTIMAHAYAVVHGSAGKSS